MREMGAVHPAIREQRAWPAASHLGRQSVGFGTNGVNTNEAAAKMRNFERLGKQVPLGTFGKINIT